MSPAGSRKERHGPSPEASTPAAELPRDASVGESEADRLGAERLPESDDVAPEAQSRGGPGGAIASAASALAGTVGSAASTAASVAAGSVGSVARPIIHEVEDLASGARRRLGARGRRSDGRDPSVPLPLLYDVHPEARRAAPREIGLKIVPIESIRGTAVEGPAQRGSDFLPLKPRRGADWEARFRRIQRALERLDTLPAVDLVRFDEGYWVLDGHNRVGAGLLLGQVAVDANVTDLRLPGSAPSTTRIAQYLEGSGDLRAAGTGRRRSTSSGRQSVEPSRLAAERQAFHDAEEDDAFTAGRPGGRDRPVDDDASTAKPREDAAAGGDRAPGEGGGAHGSEPGA